MVSGYAKPCRFGITLRLSSASFAQVHRGPSTPEERARAVQIAKALRADPTAPGLQPEREWLIKWLIEIPDISVSLCSSLMGDLGDSKTSAHPGELIATMMAAQAAFVIENPSKAKDKTAVYNAGIEGALDAYKAIRAKDPSYTVSQLNAFEKAQSEGKLADSVKSAAKKCK